MNYKLLKEIINLLEDFELSNSGYENEKDLNGFKRWIADNMEKNKTGANEPEWEGKDNGRSPESVISTLLVHLNRYAKTYSRAAISGSDFSTQEEYIYLINLNAFGAMNKMELIKRNIQEKPVGMQIINRLIKQGWIKQVDSKTDKRSKVITITPAGLAALNKQMDKIRQASKIVAGNLSTNEKMELIRLLNKLEKFHHPIFSRNIASGELLDIVNREYLTRLN